MAGLAPWVDAKDWSLPRSEGAEVAEEVWDGLAGLGYASRGQKQAGLGPADDADLIRRPARSYQDERVPQLLRHLSGTLLRMLKHGRVAAVEVQAMYVNGRVLVSENTADGRGRLATSLRTTALAIVAKTVRREIQKSAREKLERQRAAAARRRTARRPTAGRGPQPITEARIRGAIPPTAEVPFRYAGKLLRAQRGDRSWQQADAEGADVDEAEALLEILRQRVEDGEDLVLRRDAETAGLIDADEYRGKVIVVDGPASFHAEQNLMWALKTSGTRPAATIAGVKRPCLGCYLTLRLMNEVYGARITYNQRHGFAWAESIRNLPHFIAHGHVDRSDDEPPAEAEASLDDDMKESLRAFLGDAMSAPAHVSSRRRARGIVGDDPGNASESDSDDSGDER